MRLKKIRPKILQVKQQNSPVYYIVGGYDDKYSCLENAIKRAERLNTQVDIYKITKINALCELEQKVYTVKPKQTA